MLIREGRAGIYRNIIVHGFKNKAGLDIDNASTIAQTDSGARFTRHFFVTICDIYGIF